ncbi:MAG TPA: hypothetical protein VJB18_06890 [Burkholderiales bacterium]|nr:hypothetical protein [Burkholderiales bacterium]
MKWLPVTADGYKKTKIHGEVENVKRPILTAVLTAVLMIFSVSVSAAETAADRERNIPESPQRSELSVLPTDVRATDDPLQTARKPDETPFSEIKILPSF